MAVRIGVVPIQIHNRISLMCVLIYLMKYNNKQQNGSEKKIRLSIDRFIHIKCSGQLIIKY